MPSYPQAMDIHAGRYSGTSSTANIDGSATEPSVAFGDDQDTGMYSPNPNKIAFTTGGAQSVCIDSDGIDLPTGKVIKINGNTILTATGFTGTAEIATNVTVADESSDTTCFPLFAISATGNLEPKSGSNLTFNSSSGTLTATTFSGDLSGTVNTTTTAATQSAGNNSTKLATTAYVDAATSALVDSAPETLNTLDELAEALGDDDDIANTLTTNIATKLPLAGGTMTGNIAFSGSQTVDGRDVSADGSKLDGVATSANNYTHPNHSGDVTSSADGATTIAADAVTGAKIADDAIDSEHYTDGSIDTAHIAADQITAALIADDAVGAEHIEVLDADLQFADSAKAKFGTGDDIWLYHDGTNSYFSNSTGQLKIQSDTFRIRGKTADEMMISTDVNGTVALAYDGVQKFETTSIGVQATGHIFSTTKFRGNDDVKVSLGTSEDLQIYHNGSDSYLTNATGGLNIASADGQPIQVIGGTNLVEVLAKFIDNGAVELYYDNSKKLETTSAGLLIHEDTDKVISFSGGIGEIGDVPGFQGLNTAGSALTSIGMRGTDIRFATGSAERARIDSNGVVQIQDSTSSTQGNSQLLIRKGIGGATPESITRANSYLHLGGTEWGSNAAGIYTLSFGYTNSTTGTNVPAYVGFKETSTSGYTLGDLVFGLKSATGDIAPTENLRITSDGVVRVPDNGKFTAGASDDLQIYHDGTNSIIDNNTGELRLQGDLVRLMNSAGSEVYLEGNVNGNVELYYDNSKKFETNSSGCQVTGTLWADGIDTGDNEKLLLGDNDDLEIYHDGSHSRIKNTTGELILQSDWVSLNNEGSTAYMVTAEGGGAVKLYHNGSEKIRTTSTGFKTLGNAQFDDDRKVVFGDSSNLEIYYDNTNGNNKIDFDQDLKLRPKGTEDGIVIEVDGAVKAWYNDAKKFETTSSGVTVQGSVTETSDIALKRNITLIDNALDKIKQIKGYTYQFKENGQSSVGVIAQEVEKVFPQLVHGQEGSKGVDYSGLIGALIESVKELNTEVITNASEIVNNESRITGCTSNISGVIDEDEIESKTKIQDGINKVKALNSYQVRLKADNKIRDAFISRDVQTIYGREETSLIPTLTAALSEAIQKIEALEAKVSALEAK